MNKATVADLLAKWKSRPHFELNELVVENDDTFRKGNYKFRLGRKFINIGNAGQALQLEGYLLVHPFDLNYLVIVSVLRDYDLVPEVQDTELHDEGIKLLSSVSFSEPTQQERERMHPTQGKWLWIKP